MSAYTVYLEGELAERLRELAHADRRRPRSQAEILLVEAFEAEGHHAFGEADSPSASLVRRLLLQARGEALAPGGDAAARRHPLHRSADGVAGR